MVREVHAAELGFHQSQTLWLSVPAQQFTLKPFEQAHTDSGGSDGARHMFAQNWSTKLEYQYYNFGDVTFVSAPPIVPTTFKNDEHTIKLGLNYRFNWAGMAGPRGY